MALSEGDVQSGGFGGRFAQGGGMQQRTDTQAGDASNQNNDGMRPNDDMRQGNKKPNDQREGKSQQETPESVDDATTANTVADATTKEP